MGQQQQQGQGGDTSMAPAWIMALLFLASYVIWRSASEYIVSVVFYFNVLQGKLINLVVHSSELDSKIYLMETLDPRTVEWGQLVDFTYYVGTFVRYPVIFVLVILSGILYRSDVTVQYRKTHSMKSLSQQEQHNWPAIMPVISQDLVSMDINVGPWAMALTPVEFSRKYNLLKKNDMLLDDSLPGQEMTAGLRRGDAKRVFTLQLGPSWEGHFDRCPLHVQALAAVFMARMNRDKTAATEILQALDKSFVLGKLHAPSVPGTLQKYQQSELVKEIYSRHAYLLTVLASLLEAARLDGVVPSSEFLWLKPTDRRLWYMMNCIGRQTPYAEVAGAFAHWRAEKAMGRSSRAPMIDEAIKALEIAIKEVKLSPKELQGLLP
ncbi:MAG: type IVB secretion system coupling complex protein DotM/IcmP [Legionellaceae bacterium]|nr:type IVB secretion system coupling complex protein DotM/IcmP [Legionellaceae bacterium]